MRDIWVRPWVGKIPWRRKWQPTPVFLPGESHGRRRVVGYSARGHKESDMIEQLHFSSLWEVNLRLCEYPVTYIFLSTNLSIHWFLPETIVTDVFICVFRNDIYSYACVCVKCLGNDISETEKRISSGEEDWGRGQLDSQVREMFFHVNFCAVWIYQVHISRFGRGER